MDARRGKMKMGARIWRIKPSSVDLERARWWRSGKAPDRGDTTTLDETLCGSRDGGGGAQVGREAELRPTKRPTGEVSGIEETGDRQGLSQRRVVKTG